MSHTLPVLEEDTLAIGEAGPADFCRWDIPVILTGRFRDYPIKLSAWGCSPEGRLGHLFRIKWKREQVSKSHRALTFPQRTCIWKVRRFPEFTAT